MTQVLQHIWLREQLRRSGVQERWPRIPRQRPRQSQPTLRLFDNRDTVGPLDTCGGYVYYVDINA